MSIKPAARGLAGTAIVNSLEPAPDTILLGARSGNAAPDPWTSTPSALGSTLMARRRNAPLQPLAHDLEGLRQIDACIGTRLDGGERLPEPLPGVEHLQQLLPRGG